MWYFMIDSGVHATITGVILAFVIPFGSGDERSVSYKVQKFLHTPVAFIILPLFALANTSISIGEDFYHALGGAISVGVIAGLVVGKPVGVFLFTYITVKLKLSELAPEISWKHILGAGMLAGIGFTMSIFVSLLAFDNPTIIDHAKIAVLLGSLVSGVIGFLYLKSVMRMSATETS
jgi:NhaA family Na+:H+ antiporter